MLVSPKLFSTSPVKPGKWKPRVPSHPCSWAAIGPRGHSWAGAEVHGAGLLNKALLPCCSCPSFLFLLNTTHEGWKCRGHLSTAGQQASGKCQENPRNTGLNKSVYWFTNRDQNTCSFKLGLLRFYLQRDILLPETAIGMSPFWRAGQGCRLHPNKPSTHWQHSRTSSIIY